jgi:hypothetical protein
MMPSMEVQADQTQSALERRGRVLTLAGLILLLAAMVQISISYGACPQDDAFISFRYARNLVRGHGLVFNPGEWVEGYSNLSWTLIMAGLISLDLDPIQGSAILGVASVAATMVLLLRIGRSQEARALSPALLIAPGLMAIDAEMILEAVEGLETTFYMLLLCIAVLRGLQELKESRPHWLSTAFFGLALLTRPEAPLIFGLFHLGAWLWARDRPDQLRRGLHASAVMVCALVLLTVWRLHTYGAPLPNTFYAKTGGMALPRGLSYLGAHVAGHLLLWCLVVLRLALGGLDSRARILLMICGGQLAYVLWVGGDFKPTGRFVIPILPFLCLLAQQGLCLGWNRAQGRIQEARRGIAGVAGTAIVLAAGAHDLDRGLQISQAWAVDRQANLESRRLVGLFLREQFPPDTWLAVHSAGVIPYYAELPTIDMWGLSNAHIARTKTEGMGTGLAGHEKTDPAYVFSLEPQIYLPEDKIFTFQSWEQELEPGFPEDFEARYTPKSIPFPGERVRHLNLWLRRGLLRCLNSGVVYEQQGQRTRVSGRYQVSPCSDSEIQTWADLDQDGIPARDPSCCFATLPSAPALVPSDLDLRRFILATESEWDCDDDEESVGSAGPDGCPDGPTDGE